MERHARAKAWTGLLAAMLLAGCASTAELIDTPSVRLTRLEVRSLGFSSQTFRLGFDVSNPNPFPLPVLSVSYGLELDGQRFASGETDGDFTIPANGDGEFAISVELDLLESSPALLSTVRDAARRDIPYALKGNLAINIPFARPVKFESAGQIRFDSGVR